MARVMGFKPTWVSPPGDTIADILQERSLSISDLAQYTGQTIEAVNALLEGRTTITLAIARRLKKTLGGSVAFWMTRDFQYREDAGRIQGTEQDWLALMPIGDMIKFGWLSPIPHPSEEAAACLKFFDVPDVQSWREKYIKSPALAAFRTSLSFDSQPAALSAWLRRGVIEGEAVECMPWHADRFRESLSAIRPLTREKDPSSFVPKLRARCARNGVAFVIIRAPAGCRSSGATQFLSPDKALLQLSFRYLTDDQFWFTFFHEAGHLLLHGKEGFFVEGVDTALTTEEEEANNFAANVLVPTEMQSTMLELPMNARKVIRFARRTGVSPGIIVGQLQHAGRLRYNQLNNLKRRFRWMD
jgi:HTH-type transcriptional regulator/antitoxin HigA